MARSGDPGRWSDSELLLAISDRDGAAFAVFYRRHLPGVLAFLVRETGDREVAADLAAEVFAGVMLAAGRYRPQGSSAAPWVFGIARNKLRVSRRRRRVEDRARRRLGFEPLALDDVDLDRVEQVASDGLGAVGALVELLPADERDAVRSRVLQDKSYAEIAAQLQCSELVVRKRVSRGLGRMRAQLEEPQ